MTTIEVPGVGEFLNTALRFARRGVSLKPGTQLGH